MKISFIFLFVIILLSSDLFAKEAPALNANIVLESKPSGKGFVYSANKTIFADSGTTFGLVYDDDDGPINGKEREVDIDIQGNVNISSVGQFETVETSGSIRIGDEDVVCDSNSTGKIRFTGTDFEGFDGNNWASFSSPGPGVVYYAIGDKGPAGRYRVLCYRQWTIRPGGCAGRSEQ